MKTKINALALYMASDEVISAFGTKNLNLRDEIEEKINFLQKVSGKEIIIKSYSESSVEISQYSNSTKYQFPIYILEDQEESEEEKKENIQEIENIKYNFSYNFETIKKNIIIIFFISLLIFGVYNGVLEKNKTKADNVIIKSEFTILTEEANMNRLEISKELELQKQLRTQIKESIQRVTKKENKNNEIRNKLILLSNS